MRRNAVPRPPRTPDPTLPPHAGPPGGFRRTLGLALPAARPTLGWAGVTAAVLAAHQLVSHLLGRPPATDFLLDSPFASSVAALVLLVVVAAPLLEEVFFRGLLQGSLAITPLGGAGAAIVASAVWTGFHPQYDPFDLAAVFVLGLVFGFARVHTGSLLTPILLHFLVNALGLTAFLLRHG